MQAERPAQAADGDTHPGVVVDDRDREDAGRERAIVAHHTSTAPATDVEWIAGAVGPATTGRKQCTVAPASALFSAHSRPPCAATMLRAIDSPRPSPLGLVVTNGSKSRSSRSGAMPAPWSRTVRRTPPAGSA